MVVLGCWQPWEVNKDLFDCLRKYYKNKGDEENVKCYEPGEKFQSEEEE
jgi:hypothetical protein